MTRQLHPKLREFFLSKLHDKPDFALAVAHKDARLILQMAMKTLIGIREAGSNRGRIIELLQETIGRAEGESYCMSGVMSGIAFGEEMTGLKSPIVASEHCLTVWRETPKIQRVQVVPLPGAIAIWQHWKNGRPTEAGHTGVTISRFVNRMGHLVECNTGKGIGSTGEVERNGDGCYETLRSQDGAGSMKMVGFLKPW